MSQVQVKSPAQSTSFHPATPPNVRRVLERARNQDTLVRVFYGDTLTGRDWGEEFDTVGYVGRSTGTQKVPLLIERLLHGQRFVRACGGNAILDHCIVRIMDATSGRDLYRHALYTPPQFVVSRVSDQSQVKMGLPYEVFREGTCCARFKTFEETCLYVSFILGAMPSLHARTLAQYRADFKEAA